MSQIFSKESQQKKSESLKKRYKNAEFKEWMRQCQRAGVTVQTQVKKSDSMKEFYRKNPNAREIRRNARLGGHWYNNGHINLFVDVKSNPPKGFIRGLKKKGGYMMRSKPILCILCGLQCSGKSTIAKELAKEYEFEYDNGLNLTYHDAVILSSDALRKENPSYDNNQIFIKLYEQMNYHLKHGSNVIADATNITLKSRQQIFEKVKEPCEKIAYVMNISYEECRYRVCRRNIECCKEKLKENLSAKEIQMWEERLLENQSALKEFE